jgi:NAD(P)-dependent dehydrogenase (short-subunit alcohol dehydrogenase family)
MAQLTQEGPGKQLVVMKLDVTKPEDIKALVARVEAENPQGVFALVNNAGEWVECL